MQLMLDGGFGDLQILDSTKYRSLYIAKVYENVAGQKRQGINQVKKQEDNFQFEKFEITIQDDGTFQFDLDKKSENYEIFVDMIGLSQIKANRNFYTKFITIQSHLNNQKSSSTGNEPSESISSLGHPVMRLIKKFQRNMHQILTSKLKKEI